MIKQQSAVISIRQVFRSPLPNILAIREIEKRAIQQIENTRSHEDIVVRDACTDALAPLTSHARIK